MAPGLGNCGPLETRTTCLRHGVVVRVGERGICLFDETVRGRVVEWWVPRKLILKWGHLTELRGIENLSRYALTAHDIEANDHIYVVVPKFLVRREGLPVCSAAESVAGSARSGKE